eukprot:scaffold63830_cov67-Attheya_sp.AAC.3
MRVLGSGGLPIRWCTEEPSSDLDFSKPGLDSDSIGSIRDDLLTTGLDSWDARAIRRAYGAWWWWLHGHDVLIAGSEPAVSICGFPAFVGDGEYAANGVGGRGAFVSEFGRWVESCGCWVIYG